MCPLYFRNMFPLSIPLFSLTWLVYKSMSYALGIGYMVNKGGSQAFALAPYKCKCNKFRLSLRDPWGRYTVAEMLGKTFLR